MAAVESGGEATTSSSYSSSCYYKTPPSLSPSSSQLMDRSHKLLFTALLLVGVASNGARGDAVVTGTVYCDQCKDGHISLYDYAINGIKVTLFCPGGDGKFTSWGEETSNWIGNYAIRISGTPNLSSCYTQVSAKGQGSNACGAASGPHRSLRLMFNMFDTEMYAVEPLLAQPAQPVAFCLGSSVPATPPADPPVKAPSARKKKAAPRQLPPVPRQLPPLPQLPPIPHLPPTPFLEASACPHQKWLKPEYRCYWKVVRPETTVAVTFGVVAAHKYGRNMTLGEALLGRGDPYKTLLREGTTALLNSYNSVQFPYQPHGVVEAVNWALVGPTRRVMHTALSFIKANSGTTCRFTSCK